MIRISKKEAIELKKLGRLVKSTKHGYYLMNC